MKTAIITGASSGIGMATAKAFASAGYAVLINYNSNKSGAEEVKSEILKSGGVAEIYRADVSDFHQCEEMVSFSEKTLGSTEVLVANAGKSLVKLINDTTEPEWNDLFKTNVNGVYNAVRSVVNRMIDRKRGRIITVSSVWGIEPAPCEAAYAMTKAGVIALTKSVADELCGSGVITCSVAPGLIDTDMNAGLTDSEKLEFVRRYGLTAVPTAKAAAENSPSEILITENFAESGIFVL